MILFWEVLKTFYSWIFAITSSYEIDPQNSDDCIIKERIVLNFHLSKKKKTKHNNPLYKRMSLRHIMIIFKNWVGISMGYIQPFVTFYC